MGVQGGGGEEGEVLLMRRFTPRPSASSKNVPYFVTFSVVGIFYEEGLKKIISFVATHFEKKVLNGFRYANKPISSMNFGATSIPPPPAPASVSSEGSEATNYIFKCPICLGKAENETLLPISGLVFCYRCIIQQLRTEGKCPVTNFATNEEQLVRIYPSENE